MSSYWLFFATLKNRLLKWFFRTEFVFWDKNFQFSSQKTNSVRRFSLRTPFERSEKQCVSKPCLFRHDYLIWRDTQYFTHFRAFLHLRKFKIFLNVHLTCALMSTDRQKKCRSSYEACIFRMRKKNYASFLGAVFFTVFGRVLPWLPKIILPRLVLLSPLPIVAFFFLMKNFKKIID